MPLATVPQCLLKNDEKWGYLSYYVSAPRENLVSAHVSVMKLLLYPARLAQWLKFWPAEQSRV